MKYRRKKTHLTKYISCKSASEKERLYKISKIKRRVTLCFSFCAIIFMMSHPGNTVSKIQNAIATFSSNESDVFLSAKNYMTEKLSFLNKIGKSGARFRDDYLKPQSTQAVQAQTYSSLLAPQEEAKTDSNAEQSSDSGTLTEKKEYKFSPSLPHSGEITSLFGERIHPISGEVSVHNGIDIAANEGDAICAIESGIIEKAEFNEFSGNLIIIRHSDSITSSYAHMSKLNVKNGDEIKKGDIIGFAGSTGTATGPHLHMEIRINKEPVNPEDYFSQG